MPDRRNGIRQQGEMIREGMGHALAVPDTGNGTARNQMEMNMKMSVSVYSPAARAGAQGRYKQVRFHGLGEGGSSLTRTPSPPLLVPCNLIYHHVQVFSHTHTHMPLTQTHTDTNTDTNTDTHTHTQTHTHTHNWASIAQPLINCLSSTA